ncbi:MAG: hypothetical protein V4498_05410, partial [candidate division FCPU426 bacterium]
MALDFMPTTYVDGSGGTGYGESYCVIKADNTVTWEFQTNALYTPSVDRQTFLASNNATALGSQFYFWLSKGMNGNYTDKYGFGDAVAIFNPSSSAVTVDFYRGSGRGVGGTFWKKIYTKTISPDSIFMIGGSVDAPSSSDPAWPGLLPGNPYFYGTWGGNVGGGTTTGDYGDYAVASQGGPILVWKSNMFSSYHGTAGEPNDDFSYGIDATTGAKIGTNIYGASGGPNLGEVLITNLSAGTTTYDLYRYVPSATFPAGGTYDPAFPTGTSASGTWSLFNSGSLTGIGSNTMINYAVQPGAFWKVLSSQNVQVAYGDGILDYAYGDGDYAFGINFKEALDTEFYLTANTLDTKKGTAALMIMAPEAGTVATVSTSPARAGFPVVNAATTTQFQGIKVPLETTLDGNRTTYHITTNVDNLHPVYAYLQSAGAGGNGSIEKFFSNATPKTNKPFMTLGKQVDKLRADPGDTVTYTINYANSGTGPATSVVITDTIPAYTQYSSDTGPSGSWASGSGAAGSVRQWNIGSVPQGGFGSFTVVLQLLSAAAMGDGTHVISNKANIKDATGAYTTSPAAVTLNVVQPSASWTSYTALDDTNLNHQSYVHFYTLQTGTNVQLFNAIASDVQINNSVMNSASGAFRHQRYGITPNPNKSYFKVLATYPINWEIDSTNLTHGQAGRHMFVYSTDMHLKDRVFLTHLDYEIPGSVAAPYTNYGDSVFVINPGATALPVLLYFSSDDGANWTQVAGATIAAGSIWRYGGAVSSTAGDYMVVSPDGDVMVYKGTALSTNYSSSAPTHVDYLS